MWEGGWGHKFPFFFFEYFVLIDIIWREVSSYSLPESILLKELFYLLLRNDHCLKGGLKEEEWPLMLANSKGQSLTEYTAIGKWLLWKIIWQGIVNVIIGLAQQHRDSEKNWYIKTSQELRMLSRSPSDCRSLLLTLNLNLNRCLCSDCSDCSAIVVLL